MRPLVAQLSGALALVLVGGQAAASTCEPLLKKKSYQTGSGRLDLILQVTRPLDKQDEVKLAKMGGYVYRFLPALNCAAVNVPRRNLGSLMAMDAVKHVSLDRGVQKLDDYTVPASRAGWSWEKMGVDGSGVAVAVLDSGVKNVPDLKSSGLLGTRLLASINFSPDSLSSDDKCGHGTHVAGIIAGNGSKSSTSDCFRTFMGIAPKSSIVNVRVLDAQGGGKVSQVLAGINWIILSRLLYNIRVMNLSIGHEVGESYLTDPLCLAVETAWKTGIFVVVAAGNTGRVNVDPVAGTDNEGYGTNYGSIQSPGNDPYVMTVGAMKKSEDGRAFDTIATYSSRGPSRLDFIVKPDIVAPGNRIISTNASGSYLDTAYRTTYGIKWNQYKNTTQTGYSTDYFKMSGTSMAAPVVAGAAALLFQKYPGLSPDSVKARLMVSADKWTNPDGIGDVFTYGAGYLNLQNAFRSTVLAQGYALSPRAERKPDYNVVLYPITGLLNNLLWGSSGLLTGGALYGDRAMWGTGTDANRAMWGTGVYVYENRAMWGTGTWTDTRTYNVDKACADLGAINLKGEK
ncbi:MAG TPA: S8 family peptidase [Fimbriimonas sp.]|nr:S8 family peptidase [Fimbriimonas sp.]